MYFKFLCALVVLMVSLNSMAHTKQQVTDTIPFAVYKATVVHHPMCTGSLRCQHCAAYCYSSHTLETNYSNVSNVSIDEIKTTIERVKKAVCSTVGDADVKIWLSSDVGGKLIVSASVQSGVEVTFHCKGK